MKNYNLGKFQEVKSQEILDFFAPVEGLNCVYYGKVRNGKTRTATADILELLKKGEVVYANWKINFDDFDEREDFVSVLAKFVFGQRYFYRFPKENFHYMKPDDLIMNRGESTITYLNRLVGVHLFIDEGQWIMPSLDRSYDDEAIAKMKLVLHGGHYCRSLNIITQRPSNISKNARSQVNFWYRCVKHFDMFGFMIFQRWQIEDMKEDMPVETIDKVDQEGKFVRTIDNGICKTYFVWKKTDKVFKAYNTHGMRADDAIDDLPEFDVYELSFKDRFLLLAKHLNPLGERSARSPRVSSVSSMKSRLSGNSFVVRVSQFLSSLKKSRISQPGRRASGILSIKRGDGGVV